jgi:hypothetical protein
VYIDYEFPLIKDSSIFTIGYEVNGELVWVLPYRGRGGEWIEGKSPEVQKPFCEEICHENWSDGTASG